MYYNLFGISLEELHARVFQKLFAKKPLALFEKEIEPFLEENLQSLLNLPIVERLKKAQEEGHLCAIFSSSPSFLVGPIAKRLNVEEWFSSEYEIDKDRRLCKIKILMDGKKKARLLQELAQKNAFSKENLYCYSDSVEDLPFLLVAGHAIAINPDRKLKKIAKKNGWEIL